MTPRETFHQAKIEHFVRKASDFVRMGRYPVAHKTVEEILVLDPLNGDGIALRTQIEAAFAELMQRSRANGEGHNGERRRRNELVLCVDQDERVLVGLSATLRRHGYRCVGAASYDEATDMLERLLPEAVVSEVNFAAGARGFDLFLYVRSNPAFAHTPFLFHATRIDRDVLIAGKRFGVDDFITKPADGEVVAAAVTQALQRRKQAAKAE